KCFRARANDTKALPEIIQNHSGRFALQLGRLGSIQEPALQTLRDGLNRGQRVVQLMPKNSNEPLPRFALFVTERTATIANNHQVMRQSSLAKRPATQPPAPGTSGKGQLHRVRGFAFQASAESQFFRGK